MKLLHTLGHLQLVATEAPAQPLFTGPKPLLMLAYLALEGPTTRRHLAELFFAQHPDPLDNVSATARRLRQIDESVLISDGPELICGVRCDYTEALHAISNGSVDIALDLYRGSFLRRSDVSVFGAEFESWAYQKRSEMAEALRTCLLENAELSCVRRRPRDAGRFAEQAWLLSGADEPTTELLARLHGVLLALQHPREAEVRREAISFGVRELSATPEDALGVLSRRLSLTQADNLPLPPGPFIGRDHEIDELTLLLRSEDVRLVTLQGLGGAGKSQLALEVGRRLAAEREFMDGVHFVRLEPVTDYRLLPLVLATTLGLTLQGTASHLDQLIDFIGHQQMLLILDNFEQLIEAAEVTTELLTRCPGVKLLVTSRVRLGTQPEVPVTVDGLQYPEEVLAPAEALTYDAVNLFVQRARMHDRSLRLEEDAVTAIVRICRAVAGLPLGLELSAAWSEHLDLEEIAKEVERAPASLESQLRGVPERHRSLQATLDYSWSLLSAVERVTLRELTVFRGGFCKEAAASVLGTNLRLLASLVQKSLLRVHEYRYELHPLLHEYARGHLRLQSGRLAQLNREHARYYFRLLSSFTSCIISGSGLHEAVSELNEERANLAAAWRWCIASSRHDWLLEAYEGLAHYGEFASAQTWVITLLREAAPTFSGWEPGMKRALLSLKAGIALLSYRMEDAQRANTYARRIAAELQGLELPARNPGLWAAHYATGLTSMMLGDFTTTGFLQAAAAAARDVQITGSDASVEEHELSRVLLGVAHTGAAMNFLLGGRPEEADEQLSIVRDYFESVQSNYFGFYCRVRHSACLQHGEHGEAARWLSRGLEVARAQHHLTEEANLEVAAAAMDHAAGDNEAAEHKLARVRQLLRNSNDGFIRAPLRSLDGWLQLKRGRIKAAADSFLSAIEYAASIKARVNLMEPLLGFAHCQFLAGDDHSLAHQIMRFLQQSPAVPAPLRPAISASSDRWQPDSTADSDPHDSDALTRLLTLLNEVSGRSFRYGRNESLLITDL